jgi:fibronectin-binding autotransporter adhesin
MKTHHPYPIVRNLASACSLFALLFASPVLRATTYTWVPSIGGNWDTTTANWNDGATNTTYVDGSGNSVVFNGFAAGATVTQSANFTTGSLTLNSTGGTATLIINGGKSLDVPVINTVGDSSIDMFSKITGSHGLTFNATSTTNNGRLNLKTVNDYTGDTFLTGKAYVTTAINNTLPTGTTLNMAAGTTFRFATNNVTQEIAGLIGSSTANMNATSTGNTLTINTKSGTTTTHAGNITSTTGLNLVITGSGTQAINGTNSFTGSTTVSGGTLSLGSSLTASSSVTISGGILTSTANATLGAGAVSMSSGEINIRGAATTGTFTVAANQTFSTTGGKLTFNIGTASDQIIGSGVSSTFSIGSGTELALILGSGFSYANSYTLLSGFNSGSVASTGFTISGYDTTNYVASLSSTGVLSFSAASVPEPSTYAVLAGAAMLGFVAVRRRRTTR